MRDISVLLPSLSGGGAERVMVTLANGFATRGFAVDLVVGEAEGPFLNDVVPTVRIVDLKVTRMVKALLPLVRYLRDDRPEALLSALTHTNVVSLIARLIARVPTRIVISERGTISAEDPLAHGVAARSIYALVPWVFRWADGICTVSQAASLDLAHFAKLSLEQIQTIYNPFDLNSIDAKAAEDPGHPWFMPGQPPVILAAGRLNEAKDFSTLIRAFARVRIARVARLLILGEGELRRELERLVVDCGLTEDDVQLPGFAANPFAYFARCSLFVLSSRREGLPGALIEALACGAPVVSTNCTSGPNEILQGGRWGRLVSVGDVHALADAMVATLDTPRDQLPKGRLRARDFEQDKAIDAYLELMGMPLYADRHLELTARHRP